MKRAGWTRLSAPGDKCGATWQHESGWIIRHCGHPTANWPYFAIDPAHPETYTVTHNGLGFMNLRIAMDEIEAVLRGAAVATNDRCTHGTRRIVHPGSD